MRQQESKHPALSFHCVLIAKDEQALHNKAQLEVDLAYFYRRKETFVFMWLIGFLFHATATGLSRGLYMYFIHYWYSSYIVLNVN